jgi:hypothetical protein
MKSPPANRLAIPAYIAALACRTRHNDSAR